MENKDKYRLLASEDFRGLAKLINNRFDTLEENLNTNFKKSFNEMDDHFASVEGRLDKVEGKVDKVEGKVDKIEKNMATKEDIRALATKQELFDLKKREDRRDYVFAEKLNLHLEEIDAKTK